MTLTTALAHGATRLAHLPIARRDAELLLLFATGRDRAFLLTHPDDELTPAQLSTYEQCENKQAKLPRHLLTASLVASRG